MTGAALSVASSIHPLRRRLTPARVPDRLSGNSNRRHIALTFDDGPDPASTPHFLALLERHGVRATFFLLGRHAAAEPDLLRRMVGEGHELAVHGWTHRCTALLPPQALREQLRAARDVVEEAARAPVRWYRPPYGVLAPWTVRVAADLRLETVLWSAWGRDWERRATPSRIVSTVRRELRPGGTVLLHDTDRSSAKDSWRATLAATELLLRDRATPFGPLAEHWG
ncbi:polysaccharide deacetylase family protein [Nocardioides aquiterrae]|uniref:Polysaccharide deacetylase family protein n=1 Tax=Nocardioides aquiterrae TaxID=203799 RepID=A0ABP4F4N6_9ACTN